MAWLISSNELLLLETGIYNFSKTFFQLFFTIHVPVVLFENTDHIFGYPFSYCHTISAQNTKYIRVFGGVLI